MFTKDNICKEDFYSVLKKYIYNKGEYIFNSTIDYLDTIQKFETIISVSNFQDLLLQYYKTDNDLFFIIFSKFLIANNGIDEFEVISTYNMGYKDWQNDNPEIPAEEYYERVPYAYLGNVSVYVFRTASKICFIHIGSEYEELKAISISGRNILALVDEEKSEIYKIWG